MALTIGATTLKHFRSVGPDPTVQLQDYVVPGDGIWRVTTPNTTIQGLKIYGSILPQASGIIIQDNEIYGRYVDKDNMTGNALGIIDMTNSAAQGTIIRRNKIEPIYRGWQQYGIKGGGFQAYDNEIRGCTDGIMAYWWACVVSGNWIHDMHWQPNDPGHADGTHSDCIQIQGGTGFTITVSNNFLDATKTPWNTAYGIAAIQATADVAVPSQYVINNNVVWGGQWAINKSDAPPTNGFICTRNRIRPSLTLWGGNRIHIVADSATKSDADSIISGGLNVDYDTNSTNIRIG